MASERVQVYPLWGGMRIEWRGGGSLLRDSQAGSFPTLPSGSLSDNKWMFNFAQKPVHKCS